MSIQTRCSRAVLAVAVVSMAAATLAQANPSTSRAAGATGFRELRMPPAAAVVALNRIEARRATNKSMTDVYFILNWLSNVEFSGLWVAEQKGWFRQAGLHLTYKQWAPGVQPETDVPNKGGNTFGFQSAAAIAIAQSRHVPITALYTDTQKSVFGLTVLANSKIRKLSDLRGKRVGYQAHEFYVPATMLASVGLKETDWKPVQVGTDTSQLTSGQVDASLTFLTNEPISLAMQGVKTRSFPASSYGFHFYDDVMFGQNALIAKNPGLVARVTRVVARGFAWAHQHPGLATRITVAHYFTAPAGPKARQNLEQQSREMNAFSNFSRDAAGHFSGLMSARYWQDSINILFKYHQISSKPNVSQVFTNRFNPYK